MLCILVLCNDMCSFKRHRSMTVTLSTDSVAGPKTRPTSLTGTGRLVGPSQWARVHLLITSRDQVNDQLFCFNKYDKVMETFQKL